MKTNQIKTTTALSTKKWIYSNESTKIQKFQVQCSDDDFYSIKSIFAHYFSLAPILTNIVMWYAHTREDYGNFVCKKITLFFNQYDVLNWTRRTLAKRIRFFRKYALKKWVQRFRGSWSNVDDNSQNNTRFIWTFSISLWLYRLRLWTKANTRLERLQMMWTKQVTHTLTSNQPIPLQWLRTHTFKAEAKRRERDTHRHNTSTHIQPMWTHSASCFVSSG